MVAQPVGQVPPTIGQIPFDGGFPDRPVEFAHELHLDDRLTLEQLQISPTGCPRQSVVCDIAGQSCWLPMEDRPGALWINRAKSFAT